LVAEPAKSAQPKMAQLPALGAGSAGEPRQDRPGHIESGFHLVHDGDQLGTGRRCYPERLMEESTKARENGLALCPDDGGKRRRSGRAPRAKSRLTHLRINYTVRIIELKSFQ
jgi:hypothetical protein